MCVCVFVCARTCRFLEYPGAVRISRIYLLCLLMDFHLPWLVQARHGVPNTTDTGPLQVTPVYIVYIYSVIQHNFLPHQQHIKTGHFVCVFSSRDVFGHCFHMGYGIAVLNGIMAMLTVIWSLTWHTYIYTHTPSMEILRCTDNLIPGL